MRSTYCAPRTARKSFVSTCRYTHGHRFSFRRTRLCCIPQARKRCSCGLCDSRKRAISSPEIFFSSADVVLRVFRAHQNAVPLTVFEVMWRVVAEAVLVAQFGGDFVEHSLNLSPAIQGPVAGQQPCLAAAVIGESIQNGHIDCIGISAATVSGTTLRKLWEPPRPSGGAGTTRKWDAWNTWDRKSNRGAAPRISRTSGDRRSRSGLAVNSRAAGGSNAKAVHQELGLPDSN